VIFVTNIGIEKIRHFVKRGRAIKAYKTIFGCLSCHDHCGRRGAEECGVKNMIIDDEFIFVGCVRARPHADGYINYL
jgi:hypothetical protein